MHSKKRTFDNVTIIGCSTLASIVPTSSESFYLLKVLGEWFKLLCSLFIDWLTDLWFGEFVEYHVVQYYEEGEGNVHSSYICVVLIVFLSMLAWLTRRQHLKTTSTNSQLTAKEDFGVETWTTFPIGLQEGVIAKLPYENVYQLKAVSKIFKKFIESDVFLSPSVEVCFNYVTLTALFFFIKDEMWQCAGYDPSLQKWRKLPPMTYFPNDCMPNPDLIKEYLVCAKEGLMCMNVSKSKEQEKLIVFNFLTTKWKEVPSLNHRRNPVLIHLLVDATTQSYKIIAVGSSKSGDQILSRVTEVFDSRTWQWKRTGDLPGPDYALNEYQVGVYKNGNLFCIAFLDHELRKGILRYNVELGIWMENLIIPIPFSANSTVLQLVESKGELHLFSEQLNGQKIEHCIDRIEWFNFNQNASCKLKNVIREQKFHGQSLESYPEYTCAAFGEYQLGIINSIDHSGMVYDVWHNSKSEVLQAPPAEGFGGQALFCLNPMSFTIAPSFRWKI